MRRSSEKEPETGKNEKEAGRRVLMEQAGRPLLTKEAIGRSVICDERADSIRETTRKRSALLFLKNHRD